MDTDLTTSLAYQAAEAYEEFIVAGIFRYWTPLLLERAAPRPGETALDVACGTGVVARSVVPLVGPRGRVVGLDINSAMLEVACRQYSDHCQQVEWREGRAEALPFADKTFDLVTCQQGMQFFEGRGQAAREMRRVLKPGGRAVIAVWQGIERNPLFGELYQVEAEVFNVALDDMAAPFSFADPGCLRALLHETGFSEVVVEEVSHPAYFEQPEYFVERIIHGAAAVIPAYAELTLERMNGLLDQVQARMRAAIEAHTHDGLLVIPMRANIARVVR